MPAQGTALGIGSGVENSNALKGQNRFVVKNLVSPVQGWADSHSDRIPRALPWAFLFRPLRGGRKARLQKSREVSLLRMARVSRSGREHGQAVPDLESDLVREIDRLRSPCGSVVLHLDQP